jgi:cytochrome c
MSARSNIACPARMRLPRMLLRLPRMLPPRKRRPAGLICAVLLLIPQLWMTSAFAQLRGHGGPVRALAISSDGQTAISGSFDSTAIRWSLTRNAAEQVLRFHADAVNAVVLLPGGRAATAGADGRIAIWSAGKTQPDAVLEGHTAPIAALAVSPDGMTLASASWDQTVRLWPLAGGAPRVLEGHTQNVNFVAFAPDGRTLVSVSYDQSVRIWPLSGASAPTIVTLPSPLNAVAVAADGEIAAGCADGKVYFLTGAGAPAAEIAAGSRPVISIAISPNGALLAAAGIGGTVAVIDRKTRALARTLVGPGLPVWSVAFLPDSRTLLTGGADNIIRRWNAVTGDPIDPILLETAGDPLAAYAGDRGAEIFRACVACHTLAADQANRAGPTLSGIFGRRIATLPGYDFSEALKRLDIVWTPETVSKLFEIGPSAYTPGTKMPEQRIGSEQDRAALVQFLARATTK